MKKAFLFLTVIFCVSVHAQITLDFQHSNNPLTCLRLSDSESKYYDYSETLNHSQVTLYNLNGSLYKSIPILLKSDSNASSEVYYISRALFDNDTSNIEYLISYTWDSASYYRYMQVRVVREDGTILFSEKNALSPIVYNTEEGTKLSLGYSYANFLYSGQKVFSLPGKIPSSQSDEMSEASSRFQLYPNPSNGTFSVRLQTKSGDVSTIDVYSPNGSLVRSFKSTENPVRFDNIGLSAGLYFINVRSKNLNSTAKMIIQN